MTKPSFKRIASLALLATLAITPVAVTQPAMALSYSVKIVCDDNDQNEMCVQIRENRARWQRQQELTGADAQHVDDNAPKGPPIEK